MDEMNGNIAIDRFMADSWYPLQPKFNVFPLTKILEVSDNVSIPKPVIATISSWLASD